MQVRKLLTISATIVWLCVGFVCVAFAQMSTRSLGTVSQGEIIHNFKAVSIYLNDADEPMGGRFVHEGSGFTLDLLQIESVPQTFIWVNTYPVSDKGEPHTQEHLLITKGNKGHEINTSEGMSLAFSNAFTSQLHTVYDFNTGAGGEVFYMLFQKYLDALLYPDYTDEEVSREVRNWGVTENPDKTLRLEEKGSVYNEMSSSMNNSYSRIYDTIGRMLYGSAHPLSFNAGGLPAGIRELNAANILQYHNDNYYLGNMGAITSLPATMRFDSVLYRMDTILQRLSNNNHHAQSAARTLPPPQPVEKGAIAIVDYPAENAKEPGNLVLAYPASLSLNATEDLMLIDFLWVFAGDATTNLYKLFVNSKTRLPGIDAQNVYAYADNKQGQPILIGLDGIDADNLTSEKAQLVRQRITDELKRIAAFKDHSAELKEFNQRIETGLTGLGRDFSKFVNSPPKFGFRNTYDDWYNQLLELDKMDGFKKSVVMKQQFAEIRKLLSSDVNIWRSYLEKWNLTTAQPYVVIGKANPALLATIETERKARAAAEVARLQATYHLPGGQETILHYKAVYDSNTVVLEKLERAHSARFIEHPPLTLDDELVFKQETLPGNIHLMRSEFNNMSSATTGIALNLHGVPQNKLVYLALLPELLTQSGIIKNGKAVSYEQMSQLVQQQILSLTSYYSTNANTGRAELVVKAGGNNPAESQRAVEWINDVLKHPNWSSANLPRLRDFVEQQLSATRKTMQDAEESWVNDPGLAYANQDQPLLLATSSFLTRAHNIFRLKWMLKDAGSKTDSTAISGFITSLANATANREQLQKLLSVISADTVHIDSAGDNKALALAFNKLPAKAKTLAKDAAQDLQQSLADLPDESLPADWKYLCHTIQYGLSQTPAKTLADLNGLRKSLLIKSNARLFQVGSQATEQKLNASLQQLITGFGSGTSVTSIYSPGKLINERLKARMNISETPVFVGLMNPNSQTGVFINTAPLAGYTDTTREQLLQLLAAELYGGGGKQSVYTKTTGAGLSYSTGVWANLSDGKFHYYAERTPELPQTLRFVIDEIKRSPVDTTLGEYVIAQVAGDYRSASDYESRGESMAADIADNKGKETIKNFRLALLKLRQEPNLINEVYKYKDAVYEKILPGYGIASKNVPGGSFFVIGPEKQMTAYEAYLQSVEGAETKLYRLYPRDFWMVQE